MNRSLRRLALLGLFALGVSTAGAQVLFNLSYNPSQYQLVVTPTSATASGSLSSKVFLAEYGVLFGGFFSGDPGVSPSGILAPNYAVPTTSIQHGFSAASNTAATMSVVYSDTVDRRDLNISSNSPGNMTFASSGASFVNSSTGALTITFASSVNPFMRSSAYNGGTVSIFDNSNPFGAEYTIGTYNYSVVPEPSTYAAIAGALGLAYAVYRRRRQAAAATA